MPIAYHYSMIYTVITTKENTKHRKEVINMLTNRETNAAIKRETAAESMTKALAAMGYDALTYCAMD